MTFERDPVSELFDDGARRLLERAYARPGRPASTRLENPTARHLAWGAAHGINLMGRDPVPGGLYKTRWARGFVRAVYFNHFWYSEIGGRGWRKQRRNVPRTAGAIKADVGRAMPVLGVIPAGRMVTVTLLPGGQAASRAVRQLPESQRIFTPSGGHGGAADDVADWDWLP